MAIRGARLALGPDGRRVVSASFDRTLRIWDIATRQCLSCLKGHTGEAVDAVWTPDGRMILSASLDGTVRVWDSATGHCLAMYFAGMEVRSVCAPWPDGRFACGTNNGQIHCLSLRHPQ